MVCKNHDKHPTKLHAAICEDVGEEPHRQACWRYGVSNTTLSRWLNEHRDIDIIELHEKIARGLKLPPHDVWALYGVNLSTDVLSGANLPGASGASLTSLMSFFTADQVPMLDEEDGIVAHLEDGTERRAAESLVDARDRFSARVETDPEPEDGAGVGQDAA